MLAVENRHKELLLWWSSCHLAQDVRCPIGRNPSGVGCGSPGSWLVMAQPNKYVPPKWPRNVCAFASRAAWCGQETPAQAEEQTWDISFLSHPWLLCPHSLSLSVSGDSSVPGPDLQFEGPGCPQPSSLSSETQLDCLPPLPSLLGATASILFPSGAGSLVEGAELGCLNSSCADPVNSPSLCPWLLHLVWLS